MASRSLLVLALEAASSIAAIASSPTPDVECDADHSALLQRHLATSAEQLGTTCSLHPTGPTCSEKQTSAPTSNRVQILNSNIQAYTKHNYPEKFTCFGSGYVGEYVEMMAFEEIDNYTDLGQILTSAPGNWVGSKCGVGLDSCGPAYNTGSGIAWNTDKFSSVPSAAPARVVADARPLRNNAWGVRISAKDEVSTTWEQYRKLVYAVLEPKSGKALPNMIFGAVHMGRQHGPQDPSERSQGENTGKVIKSVMELNGINAAVVCGDWNPYFADAIAGFEAQFPGQTTRKCADVGCESEIQCVSVGGTFSNACQDPAAGWVANDHTVAAVQVQFKPLKLSVLPPTVAPKESICAGSTKRCAGNQCCDGIPETDNQTFPCPTAEWTHDKCEVDYAVCPGTGKHCRGDQCCPGDTLSNGKTFPCPIANPSFELCEHPEPI